MIYLKKVSNEPIIKATNKKFTINGFSGPNGSHSFANSQETANTAIPILTLLCNFSESDVFNLKIILLTPKAAIIIPLQGE